MEIKKYFFDPADFRERWLVFDSMPDNLGTQQSETELSAAEKESAQKMLEQEWQELYGNNGVDEVNPANLEIKRFVTKEARDQIHQVEGKTIKLLDTKVTEKLREQITKIEGLDPNHERYEQKLQKAMRKYSTPEKISTRRFLTREPEKRAQLERLQEMRKEEFQKEKARFAFVSETNAEALSRDFAWLDTATAEDFESHSDYKNLSYLLPAAELTGWRKNEATRALLFQLKKSVSYRNILNGQKIGEIATHLGESSEVAAFKKELKDINNELENPWQELEDAVARIPNVDLDITSRKLKSNSPKTIEAVLIYLEDELSKKLGGISGDQAAEVEDTQIRLERVKARLDEAKAKLEKQKAELQKVEDEKKGIASKKEQYEAEIQSASSDAKREFAERMLANLNQKETNLDERADELRREVGERERDVQNFQDNTDEIRKASKEHREASATSDRVGKYLTRANEQIEIIVGKLRRKREVNSEITKAKKSKAKLSPKDLFISMEIELAKVKACERTGRKDTAKLDDEEANEAERIGRLAAKMKLEDYSAEKLKQENASLLTTIAERNKKKSLKDRMKGLATIVKKPLSMAKKAAGFIRSDLENTGKTLLGSFAAAVDKNYRGKKS